MIRFTPQWLDLREPADRDARSIALVDHLARPFSSRPELTILDLGCGTGASLRALATRLRGRQDWLLVDRETRLLEASRERLEAWAAEHGLRPASDDSELRLLGEGLEIRVRTRALDFAQGLEALDDVDPDHRLPEVEPDLVTASALLDLVSGRWLESLRDFARRKRAAVFAALIYDGHVAFRPALPFDTELVALVNRHQRTDKGFGPALGPEAAGAASLAFRAAHYDVAAEPSPWQLSQDRRALQQILIEDWRQAARAVAPDRTGEIDAWAERRSALLDAGGTTMTVGHRDLLARHTR